MFEFGIKDAIDILLVAMLLFYAWRLMKTSGSLNVFYGIMVFIVIWIVVSQMLEMKLLGSIFDKLVSVGVVALIILFQEEIRRFFLTLGSQRQLNFITRYFVKNKANLSEEHEDQQIMRIVLACDSMSKNMVGALIVIERDMSLIDVIKSGEIIDANISTELIKNLFFKNVSQRLCDHPEGSRMALLDQTFQTGRNLKGFHCVFNVQTHLCISPSD